MYEELDEDDDDISPKFVQPETKNSNAIKNKHTFEVTELPIESKYHLAENDNENDKAPDEDQKDSEQEKKTEQK